jgi:hypothetical protein
MVAAGPAAGRAMVLHKNTPDFHIFTLTESEQRPAMRI